MSRFSIPIAALAETMQADLETVVRKSTFDAMRAIVLRSPVGNPDLWQSPAPPGYVGGRFRANWNFSIGAPDASTTLSTSEGRGLNEAANALGAPVGGIAYLSNGLPYARRLEYEGWSNQAPAGMVRITAAEFDAYVRQAIAA